MPGRELHRTIQQRARAGHRICACQAPERGERIGVVCDHVEIELEKVSRPRPLRIDDAPGDPVRADRPSRVRSNAGHDRTSP